MAVNTTITLAKVFYLVALILFVLTALGVGSLTVIGLAFVAAGLLVAE